MEQNKNLLKKSSSRRIFISELAFNRKLMQKRSLLFIKELEKNGFIIYMPLGKHRGYPIIEQEIDESDAVIALVDQIWYSATCKAVEITYALEGCSANHVVKDHRPIPTFVFWNENPFDIGYLRHFCDSQYLTYLPIDIKDAVNTVISYFAKQNEYK